MPCPAQCENVVTISEPRGCPREGLRAPDGSKTPHDFHGCFLSGNLAQLLDFSASPLAGSNFSVFNELRGKKGCGWKRLKGLVHYLLDGHVDSTLSARFGPNFVTILPIGECVCLSF